MSETLQQLPRALENFIDGLGYDSSLFVGEIRTIDIITGGVWWRIQRKRALKQV